VVRAFNSALWLGVLGMCMAAAASAAAGDATGQDAAAIKAILDLEAYRGKVVYVDFWASWCKPCKESFPWLNALQAKFADQGLTVIGVNLDKKQKAVDDFLKEMPAGFKIIPDPTGILAKHYKLEAMPTSFLYDRQGRLVKQTLGFQPKEAVAMEAEILRLVAQPAPAEGRPETPSGEGGQS